MPEAEKPYRLYRGGRAKGSVPLQRKETTPKGPPPVTPGPEKPRRERHWGRWIALTLLVLLLLTIAWGAASYLSVSGAVDDANARVPDTVRQELVAQDGLLVSTPTTVLVLGTDGGSQPGRESARRSDSIMLLRTDPGKKRVSYLSIPRDLRVEIPGHGAAKINAAFQLGGPALAVRTVKALTGVEVNHVAFVDFDRFKEL